MYDRCNVPILQVSTYPYPPWFRTSQDYSITLSGATGHLVRDDLDFSRTASYCQLHDTRNNRRKLSLVSGRHPGGEPLPTEIRSKELQEKDSDLDHRFTGHALADIHRHHP